MKGGLPAGPGRDLVREYAEAARARGLKVGLYYSLVNWSWKGHWDPEKYRHELPLIVQEIHDQVKELMTGYGKIDILWYDIPSVPGSKTPGSFGYGEEPIPQNAAEFFRSQELADKVRTLQPHILINNRSGTPQDFGTPEQHITADKDKRPWEACMTKNFAPNWACVNHSVADKEVGQILFYLIDAARKGGNFLFNIGPDEKGYVCERDRKDIDILGRWLERNGEAVFGTKPDPIFDGQPQGPCSQYGMFTNKGKTAYLVLFFYPRDYIVLSKITGGLKSAEILGTGQKLDISVMTNRRYKVSGLPEKMPDELAAVIKLEFEEIPLTLNWSGAEWLDGEL